MTILLRRLIDQLRARGHSAEAFGANMVWVPDVERPGDDPPARTGSRRRAVLCRADDEGRLAWWWVTACDGDSEHEWICPAAEITVAADAIVFRTPRRAGERAGR